MFSFEHSQYLLGIFLLLPLVALFVFVLRWKQKAKQRLGDEALINQLTKNYSYNKFQLKFILVICAILLLIIAGANLRKPVAGKAENSAGIDVMIALDISKSMWAEDIKPSRLDEAKQLANNLIDRMNNNRVGIILFAGRAFLQMPLTSDYSVAKLYLSNASPDEAPVAGTIVSSALQLCNASLNTQEKKYKAVIFISDGEDHDPHSTQILQQLADNGVVVNTVGVGTPEGAPIKEPGAADYKTDANGQTVITKLNEKELQQIATQTNGRYFRLDNAGKISGELAVILNDMEKKSIESKSGAREYASLYPIFILIALLVLIAEVFISETKRVKNN